MSRRGPVSRWWRAEQLSTSPATRTWESTSTTRWSQTRSRSETTWEDSRTLSPCSATASIRPCRNSRRASGSRLATGSSRISSSGRLARPRVRASWARCPPESFPARWPGSRPSCSIRRSGDGVVPAGVEPGAEAQVVGDGEPGVGGGVLGDEADLGQLGRRRRRAAAAHLDRARGRRQQPDGQAEQGGLAGAVGADQPGRPARPGCPACSPTAPSGAGTACPGPGPAGRRSRYLLAGRRERCS